MHTQPETQSRRRSLSRRLSDNGNQQVVALTQDEGNSRTLTETLVIAAYLLVLGTTAVIVIAG